MRVWSAACSRGQESFSLAFFLWKYVLGRGAPREFSVQGTELDEGVLAVAGRGVCAVRELKGVPPDLVEDGFRTLSADRLKVQDEVMRLVSFRKGDLLRFGSHPIQMHLICCRNLLIYLRKEVQEALIIALHRDLRPGGFLVLGLSEAVLGRPWRLFEHASPAHRIYRKPLSSTA